MRDVDISSLWHFSSSVLIAGRFLMTEAGATFTCEASPLTQLAVSTFPAFALWARRRDGGQVEPKSGVGDDRALQRPSKLSNCFSLPCPRCIPNTFRYSSFLLQLSEEHNDRATHTPLYTLPLQSLFGTLEPADVWPLLDPLSPALQQQLWLQMLLSWQWSHASDHTCFRVLKMCFIFF